MLLNPVSHLIYPILTAFPVLFDYSTEACLILIAIAIPVFFFWKWFFKKKLQDPIKRQLFIWGANIITTPIMYAGLIGLFMYSITYVPKKNFNQSDWRTNTTRRFEMAEDIISSKLLIGMDSGQVKQTLGSPNSVTETVSKPNQIKNWTYHMGSGGGGLGFLFHDLFVRFENGKVVSVEHIELAD